MMYVNNENGEDFEAITFEEMVRHEILCDKVSYDGVAWNFMYKDIKVSHEKSDHFVIHLIKGNLYFNKTFVYLPEIKELLDREIFLSHNRKKYVI